MYAGLITVASRWRPSDCLFIHSASHREVRVQRSSHIGTTGRLLTLLLLARRAVIAFKHNNKIIVDHATFSQLSTPTCNHIKLLYLSMRGLRRVGSVDVHVWRCDRMCFEVTSQWMGWAKNKLSSTNAVVYSVSFVCHPAVHPYIRPYDFWHI